jgi:DNA-binding NarL/FixJ family response regulator
MTLLEIILLIIGAGCLVAGFFIPERPKTKASWEEKKEIKRMHDLIDQDLEKYKENLKKSLEDEMNEYMDKAQKGIESISDEKIKAVTEVGENAIGSINKNHDEVKDTLKAIETVKDEANAGFEKSKTALNEAKDTLKAIESAKDEAKAEVEKTKSELDEAKDTLKAIESAKDEAKAEVEKTKSELNDAKDTLKAIENAKDEAKADIEKTKSELISEIEQKETEIKAEAEKVEETKAEAVASKSFMSDNVESNKESAEPEEVEEKTVIEETVVTDDSEINIEEVISETVSDYSDDGFTGVLSDDPEDDLIKILKEGLDENETGIPDETKVQPEETSDSKKSKKSKRNTKKTVKRSAESISFASKNTDEILRLYKEGKSNVAIAKELGIGVGEVKLVIDLANM